MLRSARGCRADQAHRCGIAALLGLGLFAANASAQSYGPPGYPPPAGYGGPAATAAAIPPPGHDSITLHGTPNLPGQPGCPNNTDYELLPNHRAAVVAAFRNAVKNTTSGVYGRIEYLNVRFDSAESQLGATLPGFAPRSQEAFGAVYPELAVNPDPFLRPLLSLDPLTGDDLNGTDLGLPYLTESILDFQPGGPIFINNPLRGRFLPGFNVPASINPLDPLLGIGDATFLPAQPVTGEANIIQQNFATDSANGIRGTIGKEWQYGLFEADVWGIEKTDAQVGFDFTVNPLRGDGIRRAFDVDPTDDLIANVLSDPTNDGNLKEFVGIPVIYLDDRTNPTPFPGIPDTVTGPRQGLLLYDVGFSSELDTELNGAGFSAQFHLRPDDRWRLMALTGFRYTRLDEALRVEAIASPALNVALGGPNEFRTATIRSTTNNHLFMTQFGLRSEADLGPLTLGVQPQVGLGGVRREARVFSDNLLFNSVASTDTVDRSNVTATFNVSVYGKLQMTNWFSMRVGYEFSTIADVYRPGHVLDYRTVQTAPAIGALDRAENFSWSNLFVSGEVLLP